MTETLPLTQLMFTRHQSVFQAVLTREKLCAAVIPLRSKSDFQKIKFSSSRKSVATVNSKGKVKAKRRGRTTITLKAFNGKKARVRVTVR